MAKVLLVEDDNNLREIYEARLLAEGYIINSAKDGEEALVVAKAEKPDLIISDVMMPKISGFEMLDILRNTQGLKETKVIMLTALGQADDRTRADSLGADRYLVKSQVTLEDIVKAAHELLEGDSAPAAIPITPTVATADASMQVATAPGQEPAVAATAAPQMTVSEPPVVVPVAVEPAAAPESVAVPEPTVATPEPVTTPEPVAEPATPVVDPVPAVAPGEPLTTPVVPETPVVAPEAPAATEPSVVPPSVPPAPIAPEAPATVAAPEVISPTTPAPATEAPANVELPSLPTEPATPVVDPVPAVAPGEPLTTPVVPETPVVAPEAPAATEPAASSTTPSTGDLPASESTADEQATVNSQIEEFIKNNAVEVPSETQTPPPNATTDRIMQESVDSLIASAEHEGVTIPPTAVAPEETPAPSPEVVAPAPVQTPKADGSTSDNDGVTIAHKKIIPRPSDAGTPNLGELLAREEAKIIVTDRVPPTVVSNETPTPVVPPAPGQAPLPGNTFSPTNGTATSPDEPVDPNSIAL
jgi:CheY-like chemotaxis protein